MTDSREEFVNKDSDPLWDVAAGFHKDLDGIEPMLPKSLIPHK